MIFNQCQSTFEIPKVPGYFCKFEVILVEIQLNPSLNSSGDLTVMELRGTPTKVLSIMA